jgi:hypothetical protein
MKIDLGLESLHENEESTMSFEELMFDVLETEQKFSEEQAIFDSIDRLTFIRDYVSEHGVSDTISAMIGDQISYSSAEELVEKIDASIEALISKTTGDTLDNTLKQIKKFADFFTNYRGDRVIGRSDMKVKFVDLSEANPIVPFIAGIGTAFESYVKGKLGKDRVPTPEEMNDFIDKLRGYVTTGNTILRNMKLIEMSSDEYIEANKKMYEIAKTVQSKFHTLEMAKLLCPKTSTGDIINKLVKNANKEDKEGKAVMKTMNNPQVNAKFNSLVRGLLRVIRIVLSKGYTLVKQIDRDLNRD